LLSGLVEESLNAREPSGGIEARWKLYDIPDEADVLAVTSEPRKWREALSS
jgi:hypothetical protein